MTMSLTLPLSSIKRTKPTTTFKREIVSKIWNTSITRWEFEKQQASHDAYFHHIYQNICEAACTGSSAIPRMTQDQILELVAKLRNGGKSQQQFVQVLMATVTPSLLLLEAERAVKVAAGLLVPLNFGAGGLQRGEVVAWSPNETLEKAVADPFSALRSRTSALLLGQHQLCNVCVHSPLITSFPRSFNAKQIEYIAGFEIVWTSNLVDHLLVLDIDEKAPIKLHIFHHVKQLQWHLQLGQYVSSIAHSVQSLPLN